MNIANLAFLAVLILGGSRVSQADVQTEDGGLTKEEECFLKVLCETKAKIQYGKDSSWTPRRCDAIGRQFIKSARKHGFRPGFITSFGIHESDLREKVSRASTADILDKNLKMKKVEHAHDGGIMEVRCLHDPIDPVTATDPVKRKRQEEKHRKKLDAAVCKNAPVAGLTFKQVMNPLDVVGPDGKEMPGNIEIGTQLLADLRDNSVPILDRRLLSKRAVRCVYKCAHRTHAYWSHYNSGNGPPKDGSFYSHSVASIYHAFAEAMGTDTPELKGAVLYVQKNGRKRMADKPLTARHRELYAKIMTCKGTCNQLALTGDPARLTTTP